MTGPASVAALVVNDHNEHRLLELQTKQAVELLNSTVLSIKSPLSTALEVAQASDGGTGDFERYIRSSVGPQATFIDASLGHTRGSPAAQIAAVGTTIGPAQAVDAQTLIRRAQDSATFVVTHLNSGGVDRVGYAIADPQRPGFAVYAERAIPADRQVPVESNTAFSDLNYATYLGATANSTTLATTDVPLSKLPFTGDSVRASIPFGDSTLILVTTARGHLGGALGAYLPVILAATGLALTIATAVVVYQLVDRRRRAEQDAATISGLYRELDVLYDDQRTIA